MIGREGRDGTVSRWRREPSQAVQTVAFADIVGSSLLAEAHELLAFHCVRGTLGILRRGARAYGGRVVSEAGDGVLAVFPCACAAVRWAAVCHAAASRYGDAVGCAGLRLRIGVHRGPVLAYGTRLFGRTVHTACRLQQAAKPGETLISAEVSELIAIHGLANVTDVGAIPLRNVATPVQVYRVDRVAPSLGMGPALAAAD